MRLSFVEDTNGNRVAYEYETGQGEPRVKRIEDASGRSIDLTYAVRHVQTEQAGYTIDGSFIVVADARGPGGLSIHYDYDDAGNLVGATRSDSSGRGTREQAYEWVQRNAMRAFHEQRDYKPLLEADPEVRAVLGEAEIDRAFDLNEQLRNVDAVYDRVFEGSW